MSLSYMNIGDAKLDTKVVACASTAELSAELSGCFVKPCCLTSNYTKTSELSGFVKGLLTDAEFKKALVAALSGDFVAKPAEPADADTEPETDEDEV